MILAVITFFKIAHSLFFVRPEPTAKSTSTNATPTPATPNTAPAKTNNQPSPVNATKVLPVGSATIILMNAFHCPVKMMESVMMK